MGKTEMAYTDKQVDRLIAFHEKQCKHRVEAGMHIIDYGSVKTVFLCNSCIHKFKRDLNELIERLKQGGFLR